MQKHNEGNQIALHVAIKKAYSIKVVEQILNIGGKDLVMQQDKCDNTALHIAIKEGSPIKIIE